MTRVYLDHAATSPLRPEALSAMEQGFRLWANPSSPHAEGRAARAALEDARARVKAALGWQGEVIFTSGASEAARLAIEQAAVLYHAASAVEHDAVLLDGCHDTLLQVSPNGEVDLGSSLAHSEKAGNIAENRSLVAIQQVNSESGTILDLAKVAGPIHAAQGLLLVDAAQAAGKLALPDQADMAIISAHKFGGPIGIGALLVRDYAMLKPVGGQERGYRRGTENLPGALGMVAALEKAEWASSAADRAGFAAKVAPHRLILGPQVDYIFALTHPALSAQALLIRLDAMGFAVSAGSACSSGSLKPSRVLKAFGVDDEVARRTIRVSLGWNTTAAELEAFVSAWVSL